MSNSKIIIKILSEQKSFLEKDFIIYNQYNENLDNFLYFCKKYFFENEKDSIEDFLDVFLSDDDYFKLLYKDLKKSNIKISFFQDPESIKIHFDNIIKQHYKNIFNQIEKHINELSIDDFDINLDYLNHYLGSDLHGGKIESFCDDVFDIIQENLNYLTEYENLPQLSFLLKYWNNLYYCGRLVYSGISVNNENQDNYKIPIKMLFYDVTHQCENNPKYEISEKLFYNNQHQEDVVYDSYCSICDFDRERNTIITSESWQKLKNKNPEKLSNFQKLKNKKNKTWNEWVVMLTDDNFRYKSVYPDEWSVRNHLLCCIGNGYNWNKDGFICENMPNGTDKSDYQGWEYSYKKLPNRIKSNLDKINNNQHVKNVLNTAYEIIDYELKKEFKHKLSFFIKHFDEYSDIDLNSISLNEMKNIYNTIISKTLDDSANNKDKIYYPICDSSMCCDIPENVDSSYILPIVNVIEEISQYKNVERELASKLAKSIKRKYPNLFRNRKIKNIMDQNE